MNRVNEYTVHNERQAPLSEVTGPRRVQEKFNSFAFLVLSVCSGGSFFFSLSLPLPLHLSPHSPPVSWLIDFASVFCRERRQLMHHESSLLSFFSLFSFAIHPFLSYGMALGIHWGNYNNQVTLFLFSIFSPHVFQIWLLKGWRRERSTRPRRGEVTMQLHSLPHISRDFLSLIIAGVCHFAFLPREQFSPIQMPSRTLTRTIFSISIQLSD